MHRFYWLTVGIIVGVFGYRYFREQGGQVPGFEALGEDGQRLAQRGREFVDSGRQLASEGRQFAQTAAETAQSRGREAADTVKAQASKAGDARQREDVKLSSTKAD